MCTTIRFRSSYFLPCSFAYLFATAFWFNAWNTLLLGSSGNGGFNAYIGSNDARDLEKLVQEGDEHAKLVQDAFHQQVAKDIGAMSTVLCGKVDQIILTGGIAYSKHTCAELEKRAGFIAPFTVYPGEDELLALAQGALRVMNGEEEPMTY